MTHECKHCGYDGESMYNMLLKTLHRLDLILWSFEMKDAE